MCSRASPLLPTYRRSFIGTKTREHSEKQVFGAGEHRSRIRLHPNDSRDTDVARRSTACNAKTAKPAKRLKISSPDLLLYQSLSTHRAGQTGFRNQVQSKLQFCMAQCILDSSYGLASLMPPFVNQIPPKCYFLSQFSLLFCHSIYDDCQTEFDYIQRYGKFPDQIYGL